jgi:electron transfer flavoprotein alpha subunit
MLAVIPVRAGHLPSGGAEAAAECSGRVLLVGSGTADLDTDGLGDHLRRIELGEFAPAAWAAALAPMLSDDDVIVLPGSPDGRDLAPRLAHVLRRRLFAGAVEIRPDRITVSRQGGLALHTFEVTEPVVATLQPGIRGVEPGIPGSAAEPVEIDLSQMPRCADAEVVAVQPPDVATMDLARRPASSAAAPGSTRPTGSQQLARVATALGAAMGATRVVTDRGWVGHERQIGTTGVVVDPVLYLSFGISGAVQHTSGLGAPDHIISVNTDPHCPMMQMSDLAVVADANAVLDELDRC